MPSTIAVPLLGELAPGGFLYSAQYMVVFDADSLWYETSLSIAASAVRHGMKTEYHVFQHFPNEALAALSRMGLDTKRLEADGLLNIWDNYTATTEFESSRKADKGWETTHPKPLDIVRGAARWVERTKAGFPPEERGWLHLDDNTGIFLQYNDEKTCIDAWRTALLPSIRARECPHFLAFPRGIASDAFYTKFEALCDGIIDFKNEEVGGRIEHLLRIRALRGKTFDSRWHRLQVSGNGEVTISDASPVSEQRRLAAIMFTDTVDYTASTQADEAQTLDLLRIQAELVRPILENYRGREIKSTGDGFLVEFDSALKATQCAVDIQRRIYERNAEGNGPPMRIRIGFHLGDVVERGTDILGDAVNIAARIEPVAEPGGICVSGSVREQVWNKIPDKLEKLPQKSLKGLQVSIDIYRVVLPWTDRETLATDVKPAGIAVLPFANISPDPKDEYFADGLTEELITVLSQLRDLRVIARTSVTPYKSTTKGVSQIGAELGVSSILEGSVRKAGNHLRITVQLIDVGSQGHVWSNTYDRELDDVFALQSEMAKQVAEALKVKLLAREEARLDRRSRPRPESYLEYLQGRTSLHGFAEAEMRAAKEHFERAISLDDRNAAAHAGLADVHRLLGGMYHHLPKPEWESLSREHASRAIELDPNLAEAHASLGLILWDDYRFAAAQKELELAIALNPSFVWARIWYANVLADQERTEEALRELTLAEQLDPLSTFVLSVNISLLTLLRRLEAAESLLEKLGRVENFGLLYHNCRFFLALARGDWEQGHKEINHLEELLPGRSEVVTGYATYFALKGDRARSRELVRSIEELPEPIRPDSQIAGVYAYIGDLDACFRWLDVAVQFKKIGIQLWRLEPSLAHVRSDPRFQAILKKMNLA